MTKSKRRGMIIVLSCCCVIAIATVLLLVLLPKSIRLTFVNGDTVYHTVKISGKDTFEMPDNPVTTDGGEFEGWYFDRDTWMQKLEINTFVTCTVRQDVSVYAKFEETDGEELLDFDIVNGKVTVTGIKDDSVTTVRIPQFFKGMPVTGIDNYVFPRCSELTTVKVPEGVTTIGTQAFFNCVKLKSISIPDSVTSIGKFAFRGCSDLAYGEYGGVYYLGSEKNPYAVAAKAKTPEIKNADIHEKSRVILYEAFEDCAELHEITVAQNLKSVGEAAFFGCRSLSRAVLPDGLIEIGNFAFGNCDAMKDISIPNTVVHIGQYAFSGCKQLNYTVSDQVKYLGNSANPYAVAVSVTDKNLQTAAIRAGCKILLNNVFSGCKALENISMPKGLVEIGDQAFGMCTKLSALSIPDSVLAIGSYAFSGCKLLTDIPIPSTVVSIAQGAFSECSGLIRLLIPTSAVTLGTELTRACTSLSVITVSSENPKYWSQNNCLLTKDGKTLLAGCKTSRIPAGVTDIAQSAFYGFGLTEMIIPSSVTAIDNYAFSQNSNLCLYFEGTSEQKDAVEFGQSAVPAEVVWRFYSAQQPALSPESYWRYVNLIPVVWSAQN